MRVKCQKAAPRHRQLMAASVSTRTRQEAAVSATRCRPKVTLRLSDGGYCSPNQISVCSAISKASSTSMPRYLTVDSILE